MRSSRKRNHAEMAASAPPGVPLAARPLSDLQFFGVNPLTLQGKVYGIAKKVQDHRSVPTRFYFKKHHASELSQLEVYASTIARILASDRYVPSTRLYYDDESKDLVGMTAREMPGFRSLHENPFQAADADIHCLNLEFEQNRLLHALNELIAHHEKALPATLYAHVCGLFSTPSPETVFVKALLRFKSQENPFHEPDLLALRSRLNERVGQMASTIEYQKIHAIVEQIDRLLPVLRQNPSQQLTIEEMEAVDQFALARQVDLSQQQTVTVTLASRCVRVKTDDLQHYRIVKGLAIALTTRYILREGDNGPRNNAKTGEMIDFEMAKMPLSFQYKPLDRVGRYLRAPDEKVSACTARDLRDFPVLHDAAFYFWPTTCSMTIVKLIEFVMKHMATSVLPSQTNTNILSEENTLIKDVLAAFGKSLLITDETTYLSRRYLEYAINSNMEEKAKGAKRLLRTGVETGASSLAEVEEVCRKALHLEDHVYTLDDNAHFKLLGLHPVFKYFQYKTLLKFTLISDNVFHAVGQLQTSSPALQTVCVKDDIQRRNQIHAVLYAMPEFVAFMQQHGDRVMAEITHEFAVMREEYVATLAEEPFNAALIAALQLSENVARPHFG